MIVHRCEQGSPEWWSVRCGVPSASCFHRIITPKTGKLSAQAFPYICELIADRVLGIPPQAVDSFASAPMQQGIDMEPEARSWYEFDRGVTVDQVGFITTDDGRFGCSPDGLVGDVGGLELKCPQVKTHVGYLLNGGLPDEYKCQVHGALVVTGRKWWDFVSYARHLPALVVRVVRDEFTEQLEAALQEFWPHYESAWQQVLKLKSEWRNDVD